MEFLNQHFPHIKGMIKESGVAVLSLKESPGFQPTLVQVISVDKFDCICCYCEDALPPSLKHRIFPVRLTLSHLERNILMRMRGHGFLAHTNGSTLLKVKVIQLSSFYRKSGKIKVYV